MSQQTPQTAQPSPPTPSSGPSSSKASWSSILSAASYRNLLGSSGSKKGWKGQSPSDSKRISTVDELALANGSITPEVAAVIADLRRRRTVRMTEPSSKTVDFSAGSMHTKTRSDSFHSQPQPMRINHSATLPAFRRRVPSMNHAPTPRVPSKPVKIQANFHDPPIKELMYVVTVQTRSALFKHPPAVQITHARAADPMRRPYTCLRRGSTAAWPPDPTHRNSQARACLGCGSRRMPQ